MIYPDVCIFTGRSGGCKIRQDSCNGCTARLTGSDIEIRRGETINRGTIKRSANVRV